MGSKKTGKIGGTGLCSSNPRGDAKKRQEPSCNPKDGAVSKKNTKKKREKHAGELDGESPNWKGLQKNLQRVLIECHGCIEGLAGGGGDKS